MSRLFLAPMEGLADDVLRDVLTRIGGYDGAVTEFVRVTATRLPARAFLRVSPELRQGGRTAAGTPVAVQLLGSDPQALAESAARLAELGPPGIDLNFGCPAPTVCRHRGGAVLLDEPERLAAIAGAVRRAVPAAIPVSAKMRLGVRDPSRAVECAGALASGGIAHLTVHARTKAEMYRPPAHWDWIARIRAAVPVPVIANGEVWSVVDWAACRSASGCADVMLGRGAVADPLLARRIRGEALPAGAAAWPLLTGPLADFWAGVQAKVEARHAPGRLKIWLGYLARAYTPAAVLLGAVRPLRRIDEIDVVLRAHGIPVAHPPAGPAGAA